MTERELQDCVADLLRVYGWRYVHSRPALTARGWRTPLQGFAGFPDILACKGSRMIAAELKGVRGTVAPEQWEWLKALAAAGVATYVWHPAAWESGEILAVLSA